MTETIVVERVFDDAVDLAAVQAREDAVAWCLGQHGVRFRFTYFAVDRRAMVCIYAAPDAEAVRVTQRTAGLPVARAWPALVLGGDPAGRAAPAPLATVLVERELPEPATADHVAHMMAEAAGCLARHRVAHLASFLARDGRRMVCAFAAPDAESVRIANRQGGIPLARAWPATVHLAAAP